MVAKAKPGTRQALLNKATPAAARALLGDVLADLISGFNALRTRVNSSMLSTAGLAIKAGGSAVVKAGTACVALANGTAVVISANTDMPALAGTLATAKSAAWAFYIDATGTITVSAKTADVASTALAVAALPPPPDNMAMIGIVSIDNATGSNFVGGTTALDTGSLTVKYFDTRGVAVYAGAAVVDLEHRT